MKRARDVREQLEGLMDRVELEIISSGDPIALRKVCEDMYVWVYGCMHVMSVWVYGCIFVWVHGCMSV